ncbi:MAG: apolipoprotein N-acyltransferase [candidate division KSB1 bacterium]|nr:apolipoprotein N-acyltransferase [candidate division KSB1 bacterium]MDZ7302233.1 apolipoprotein N-acyltransferase [candidate division KSB1 bacterium]MDZ7311339.1 apolipoprotein N-acyltransferase [candidate division KSB1 bacterium]
MHRDFALSLLTAVALALSFPPFKLGFLAYWGIIPFLILLEKKSPAEAFRLGYLTGLLFSIATLYWIGWSTLPGAIATILIHPLYYALFAILLVPVRRWWPTAYLLTVPFLWTAIEYLKSIGELGFPWVTLGYTQTYYLHLIQYASYTSVYGVSFWVVSLNVLFLALWQFRQNTRRVILLSTILLLFFVIPYLYSLAVLQNSQEPQEQIRVGMVQGNVDPYQKWEAGFVEQNFQIYENLTRLVAKDKPEVVIWPETATPTWLLHNAGHLQRVRRLAAEIGAPILTGIPDYIFLDNNEYRTFNAAALIYGDDRPVPTYAKIHLVPFGERVPFEDYFPFFKKWIAKLEMGEGNFSPGSEIKLFSLEARTASASTVATNTKHLATVICFESIFPEQVAAFVRKGADLLVVITNDAWFGRPNVPYWLSGGVYQHAQIAVFRAIENRISIARCANTGITETIDPYGRITRQAPVFKEAVLVGGVPLRQETTFFSQHGHVFTHAVSFMALALVSTAMIESRWRMVAERRRNREIIKPKRRLVS